MINPYLIPGLVKSEIHMVEYIALQHLELSSSQIRMKTRKREVVIPRQIVMSFMYQYSDQSLESIAKIYGLRNHGTVIHAKKCIQDMLDVKDKQYYQVITKIKKDIKVYLKNK